MPTSPIHFVMTLFNYFNADTAKLFGLAMAQSYIEQMDTRRKLDDRKLAALSLRAVEKIEFKIKDFKKFTAPKITNPFA